MSPAGRGELTAVHRRALQRAYDQLENQTFASRLAEYAGQPLERLMRVMPKPASQGLNKAIEVAILRCLNLAVGSIDPTAKGPPRRRLAALTAGLSGAVSGFFGVAALPIELPVTTALMLRAIADTARHYGEDLSRLDARLACVEVFALGSGAGRVNGARRIDVGYFATRALLARAAGEASAFLLERGALSASTPVVNSLMSEIATRFGVVASERFAASAVPVLGAAGGATINVIFMNHFQRVAQGHFIIRRLERLYGPALIRREYEELGAGAARPRSALAIA
jgi:EcsC family protein